MQKSHATTSLSAAPAGNGPARARKTGTSQAIDWSVLRPRVRLSLECGDRGEIVSESVVELLQAVVEHGSLVAAARALHIPYRTARHRMQVVEARLGVRLFETVSGGPGGGWSRLTPAAEDILQVFGSLRDALDPFVDSASLATLGLRRG